MHAMVTDACVDRIPWRSVDDVRADIFDWIET